MSLVSVGVRMGWWEGGADRVSLVSVGVRVGGWG